MGSLSIWHWLVVLVIVMMVFGTKKLRTVGQDLGGAIKDFKDGMSAGSTAARELGSQIKEAAYTTQTAQSKA